MQDEEISTRQNDPLCTLDNFDFYIKPHKNKT